MKKLFLLLLIAIFGGPLAMNAVADDTTMKTTPDIDKVVAVDQIYNDLTLVGTLKALDWGTGEVVVNNDVQGDVTMQFEPSDVLGLNIGDTVVVRLGFGAGQRSIHAESCEALPTMAHTC